MFYTTKMWIKYSAMTKTYLNVKNNGLKRILEDLDKVSTTTPLVRIYHCTDSYSIREKVLYLILLKPSD